MFIGIRLSFILCYGSSQAEGELSSKRNFIVSIPADLDPISISTENIEITSFWTPPVIVENHLGEVEWKHTAREVNAKTLAGIKGEVVIDHFQTDGIQLLREFWYSFDQKEIAIRQKITNHGNRLINLECLIPLNLNGPKGLVFAENNRADTWRVLIQKRLKNGKPASIIPLDNHPIEIDPFCIFNVNSENTADLLIGFLSQQGHLAHLELQFDGPEDDKKFSSLAAVCQFDGCLLPVGGERTSQWVYMSTGNNSNNLIACYTDRVGEFHGVKKPAGQAPSVFCTWYFHGRNYNEKFFMDDINSLREERIPFDVFLIDDCWANGNWGYWTPGDAFPGGMRFVTDQIKNLGYRPGIWTAPYSVNMHSDLAKDHPEWLLRTDKDSLVVFGYAVKSWILDPTYPGVLEHLEKVYRRLANDYGFSYFKFDFMRSVFVFENVKFYDPHKTRLEAYTIGLEAIRKGVGPDAYISVCGGHYGGSLGIANSQRNGSDVVSIWEPKQIDCFRQNILRTWMSRLWHVDPDALMIRKRETPFHDPSDKQSVLALGTLTDEEANTFALNQYVTGGLNCFTEYLKELQPERRKLYRHVIPSISKSALPLDLYNTYCPAKLLTEVEPRCEDLGRWNTIAITNWDDENREMELVLATEVIKVIKAGNYIVSEFFSQKIIGIFQQDDQIDLGLVPAHQSRLLRVAPWNGEYPVLTGTDLHFSGGGVEIEEWQRERNSIKGVLNTEWNYPVKVTVAFPAENESGYVSQSTVVQPGQKAFYIEK
jgi:alpha-galactosidase